MLILPIRKKWFDIILSGKKKEEYREISGYNTTRFRNAVTPYLGRGWDMVFMEECEAGQYTGETFEVLFRSGYSFSSPTFKADVSLRIGEGKPEWGAEPGKNYYVLTIYHVRAAQG